MSKEPPKPIELVDEAIEKDVLGTDAFALETIVDETGRILVGREAEQYLVNATARVEEKQVGKDLELSRKGPLQNGRQNRGASLSAKISDTQKEKEKKDKKFRRAISHAQKALEASLAELNVELKEIDESLDAIAKLRALRKSGSFEKDNAEHVVLMHKAGVTSEEMESPEGDRILDEKEKEFHERREGIIKESKELIQEAEVKGYSSEAISKFKEKLEQKDNAVAYDIASNQDALEELKEAAGKVVSENFDDAGLQDKDMGFLGSMSGTSVAKNNGIGETIKSKSGNLALGSTFKRAGDPNPPPEDPKVAVALNIDDPKVV